MKKLVFGLVLMLSFASVSFAGDANIKSFTVKDTNNTDISSYSLTSGSAVNSRSIYVGDNIGFAALLATVDASGDVDIYAEYSEDNSNWYRPYISDMAGTVTVEGDIVTALSNATRYIVFTPRPAKYMRIVLDPDANSTVTLSFMYQQDL